MAALNDPHIIQVYFIGTEEATGQPFFAMEFVEGESLSGLLKREGKLNVENSLKLMAQTASGLATAHDKGVIHRDLKPGNLMINPRGQVKIADFGIALATQDFSKKLTSTGEFVGTPGYLSPEVCLGKNVDQRSDIFALGIVLYEMLAGRLPFTDESPLGLMLEVVKAEIPDIRALNAEVDPQTAEILGKMLAKEPADRFQSCHELAAALQAHPLVAKGGTVQITRPKPAPSDATVVGAPTPASLLQRAPTPPPVVPRATAASQPKAEAAPPPAPPAAEAGSPSAPAAPSQRKASKAPLWLAAAALLLLVGAGFAFRGAIGEFLLRSDDPAHASTPQSETTPPGGLVSSGAAATSPSGTPSNNVVAEGPTPTGAAPAATDALPATRATLAGLDRSTAGALASAAAALDTASASVTTGAELVEAVSKIDPTSAAAPSSARDALALANAVGEQRARLARVDPPKPVERPLPPRVAVVALGDRALSATAKQRIEERLLAEGFDLLDTDLVAGLEGRELPAVLAALRREASMLVVVRAEPLGQQQLSAYGEQFTLYSANLSVRAYLVGERRALGAGFREKVDFTTHNVNENTQEVLAPHLAQLVRELVPHRSRSAAG